MSKYYYPQIIDSERDWLVVVVGDGVVWLIDEQHNHSLQDMLVWVDL